MLSFSILALAETVDAESVNKLSELAGRFGLRTSSFLAQIVNFAIVSYVLYRFAVKPILATMDERQQKIADGLQFAEEAKSRLAESEKKQAQVIQEAQADAQRILKEARTNGEKHEERMRTETARQIEEMRRRADEANELERKRILGEVRGEVARMVVLTTGKVLRKELSDKDKDTLNTAAAREIASLN